MATREERLKLVAEGIKAKEEKAQKKKARAAAEFAAANAIVGQEGQNPVMPSVQENTVNKEETEKPTEKTDGQKPLVGLGTYEDRPPVRDVKAEAQINLINRIAEPSEEKLGEMGRIPSGMVMATIRMEYKWYRLHWGYSGRDALRLALYRQFRGRDGLLIKDLQKLKEVEADKAAAMAQRIMP